MIALGVLEGWRSLELAMHDACAAVQAVETLSAHEDPLSRYNAGIAALAQIGKNRHSLLTRVEELKAARERVRRDDKHADFEVTSSGCAQPSLVTATTMCNELHQVLDGAEDACNRIMDEALIDLQNARKSRAQGAR